MKIARAVSLLLMVAAAPLVASTHAPVDELLDRATAYVCTYVHDFSTVVAEERYVQDSHPMPRVDTLDTSSVGAPAVAQHAELRSDLLFVKPDALDSWLTFRDVYSVDGRAVRDREQRLAKLFIDRPAGAVDRASEIAREGYRYNIGSTDRTVANPLIALAFLQPAYRARFEFRLKNIDTSRGPDVWVVKFKERVRPTILRTPANRNVSALGRFWIDGASGRVLETELETSAGDKVTTVFGFDEQLQMDVPVEMRDLTWYNGTVITGKATYANFRRFDVVTDEKFR